ncbi:MAG TPA: hypothetical protein VGF22_24175 [Acidimicrobiales bacterium]
MSFLGYDPGRLTTLRRRLDELAEEAAGLHFGDVDAAEAADTYRRAVRLMTDWRPDVTAISSCAFDSPFRPVALRGMEFVDVVRPTDAAWTTVTDPRSGLIVTAEDHARHVAEALVAGSFRPQEMAAAVTGAMATPATRDIVLVTLGPHGFAAVVEALAGSIAHGDDDGDARRVLALLAAGFGAAFRAGSIERAAWEEQLADHTDPYATALVLERAGLARDALLRLASATWSRWRAAPNTGLDSGVGPASQTLPIVIRALTADPVAARRFIESLEEDDLWALLGGIDVPVAVALPLLLTSADPHSGPPADMERSVVKILTFLDERRRQQLVPPELDDGLGAYVGPYLEQLLGAPDASGYPSTRWSVAEDEAAALVAGVARNKASATSLLVFLDALVLTRFAQFVTAGPVDGVLLDHLGGLAGLTERLVADARHDVAAEQTAGWNAAWSLLGSRVSPIAALFPGPGLVSRAVSYGVSSLGEIWRRNGWVAAPPDPDALAARQQTDIVRREDQREAALMAGLYAAGRATGAIPASTPPPPAAVAGQPYNRTRTAWRQGAIDDEDAEARDTLWQACEDFEAGWGRAEVSRH